MMQGVAVDAPVSKRGGITAVSADEACIYAQLQTVAPMRRGHFFYGIDVDIFRFGEPACACFSAGFGLKRFGVPFVVGFDC